MSQQKTELTPVQRALLALKKMGARLERIEQRQREPIAVVGMACRFPGGADDYETFWRNLCEERDGIKEVGGDRWDIDAFYDPDPQKPGKMTTRWAGLIEKIDQFDPLFFGVSPREAIKMDPQQRILLEVAIEALEDAGMPLEELSDTRTGVFVGAMDSDFGFINKADLNGIDAYSFNSTGVLANRISFFLNLHGPSFSVETQCSSSLVSIHHAVNSLRRGECELALAAGVNMIIAPQMTVAFSKWGMMAPDGRCKTFDSRANGFVRGEGCGLIVLKRLSDALAAGDRILGMIRGSAVNHDGRTNVVTAPNGLAQRDVILEALENAGVSASDVTYVECHGTGTPLGDPIEVDALQEVYGALREDKTKCVMGAVKSNIGHLEGAAGIAGIVKTLQCLRHARIPSNLHFKSLNPEIQLEDTCLEVAGQLRDWTVPEGKRRFAGVSSFGAGGTNAHVILEEPPDVAVPEFAPGRTGQPHLLLLSAKSPEALRGLVVRYRNWLHSPQGQVHDLRDIAYSAAYHRSHFDHRLCFTAYSTAELSEYMDAYLAGQTKLAGMWTGRRKSDDAARLVFVCSGQGPKFWPIARELLEHEEVFRSTLERCDTLLKDIAGWSLLEELLREENANLERTEYTQPALTAIQIALAEVWLARGVRPAAVIGHSMGEVPAACIAGALSLEDALRVIYHRGRLIQRLCGQGRMAMTNLSLDEARAAIKGYEDRLAVAAENSPGSTVLSGDPQALRAVLADLQARDIFNRELESVDFASHSPQMEAIRAEFRAALQGIRPVATRFDFVSTVDAAPVVGQDLGPEYWARNIREPVLFSEAIGGLIAQGKDTFVEIAPHPVLSYSVSQCLQAAGTEGYVFPSLHRDRDRLTVLTGSFGGLYAVGYPVDVGSVILPAGRFVSLPHYAWHHERYWPRVDFSRMQNGGGALVDAGGTAVEAPAKSGDSVTPEKIFAAGESERRALLEQYLLRLAAEVMQIPIARLDTRSKLTDMGLESMMSVELSKRIQDELKLEIVAARLTRSQGIAAIAEELAARLPAGANAGGGSKLPLTPGQEGIWTLQQLAPKSAALNLFQSIRIRGEMDVAALKRAFTRLIEKNPILACRFEERDGHPVRFAPAGSGPELTEVDISDWTWRELSERTAEEANRPFQLDREFPLRARISSQTARRHYLLVCAHRIVLDQESLWLLLSDLYDLYSVEIGRSDESGMAAPVFEDFIGGYRQMLAGERGMELREYWREWPGRDQPVFSLPGDRRQPPERDDQARSVVLFFENEIFPDLSPEAGADPEERATIVLLAGFLILLHRYTGRDEIVIGLPYSLRGADYAGTLGSFTNPVPVLFDLGGQPTFAELCARIRESIGAVRPYHDLPFLDIVREVAPGRHPARHPLMQIYFDNERTGNRAARWNPVSEDQIIFQPVEVIRRDSVFDVGCNYERTTAGLNLYLNFRRSLYSDAFVRDFSHRLESVIRTASALSAQGSTITKIHCMTPEDERDLQMWSFGESAGGAEATLPEIFERRAKELPGAVALTVCEHTTGRPVPQSRLTYEQLNRLANQLAGRLRRAGLKAGMPVAVCAGPSLEFVVGLLGVLKAGGVCVPLAPGYSDARLYVFLKDSQARILIAAADQSSRFVDFAEQFDLTLFTLDSDSLKPRQTAGARNPAGKRAAIDAALVLYNFSADNITPSAVRLSHRALWNSVGYQIRQSDFAAGMRTLYHTSPGSFVAFHEIFSTLCAGGTLVLADRRIDRPDAAYSRFLSRASIERVYLNSENVSNLAELSEERDLLPVYLREIIAYGPKFFVSQSLVDFLDRLKGCRLHFDFGTPETGVATRFTLQDLDEGWPDHVPMGRPIDNTRIYVLDAEKQPVLPGAIGELYVAGVGLASGYVSDAGESTGAFVRDIHDKQNHMFRTGLLARHRSDGQLIVVGGIDQAVCARGFNFNLRDVEQALEQHPAINEALVMRNEQVAGNRLIAYIVSDRIVDRLTMLIRCEVEFRKNGATYSLITRDISPTGLSLSGIPRADIWSKGESVRLRMMLPGISEEFVIDASVMWVEGDRAGLRFAASPLEMAVLKLSLDHIRELEEVTLTNSRLLESRVPLRRHCIAELKDGRTLRLMTEAVSGTGVSLISTPVEWEKGERIVLRLSLPGVLQELRFSCTMMWRDGERTGFDFELDDEKRAQLQKFFGHFSKRRLLSLTQLRSFLQERLPDYMIPAIFVILDSLPVLPNGRVNVSKLHFPVSKWQEMEAAMKGPRSSVEGIILGIWTDAFTREDITIYDNFFEIGGDSLRAARIMAQIREAFNLDLPLQSIFVAPTIMDLAAIVTRREGQDQLMDENTEYLKVLDELSERLLDKQDRSVSPSRAADQWILRPEPNPGARLRLFCFHYAGGSARIFNTWWKQLPDEVEVCAVQLPGRDDRMMENPYTDFFALIQALQQAIVPYLNEMPFAFFGHSLGTTVAFELTRQLRREGLAMPLHLFLGAGVSPQSLETGDAARVFDTDAIEFARNLNGIPEAVLKDQGLMRIVIPILGSDLTLIRNYRFIPEDPLSCDITVYGGEHDHLVGTDMLLEWRKMTSGRFESHILPGDHFFVHSHQAELLKEIGRRLAEFIEPAVAVPDPAGR